MTLHYKERADGWLEVTKPAEFKLDPPLPVFVGGTRDYWFHRDRACVFAGFVWNGASGPTLKDRKSRRASCLHDAMYQAIYRRLLPPSARRVADENFLRILKEDGMGRVRRSLWFRSVRWFGWYWLKKGWL